MVHICLPPCDVFRGVHEGGRPGAALPHGALVAAEGEVVAAGPKVSAVLRLKMNILQKICSFFC